VRQIQKTLLIPAPLYARLTRMRLVMVIPERHCAWVIFNFRAISNVPALARELLVPQFLCPLRVHFDPSIAKDPVVRVCVVPSATVSRLQEFRFFFCQQCCKVSPG